MSHCPIIMLDCSTIIFQWSITFGLLSHNNDHYTFTVFQCTILKPYSSIKMAQYPIAVFHCFMKMSHSLMTMANFPITLSQCLIIMTIFNITGPHCPITMPHYPIKMPQCTFIMPYCLITVVLSSTTLGHVQPQWSSVSSQCSTVPMSFFLFLHSIHLFDHSTSICYLPIKILHFSTQWAHATVSSKMSHFCHHNAQMSNHKSPVSPHSGPLFLIMVHDPITTLDCFTPVPTTAPECSLSLTIFSLSLHYAPACHPSFHVGPVLGQHCTFLSQCSSVSSPWSLIQSQLSFVPLEFIVPPEFSIPWHFPPV